MSIIKMKLVNVIQAVLHALLLTLTILLNPKFGLAFIPSFRKASKWIPSNIQDDGYNVFHCDCDDNEPTQPELLDADVILASNNGTSSNNGYEFVISSLGYNLTQLYSERINSNEHSAYYHYEKESRNKTIISNKQQDFSDSKIPRFETGLFNCIIGNNPLFTTHDLSQSTMPSGFLSFKRPIAKDHIKLVYSKNIEMDQSLSVRVMDAFSGCYLGYYVELSDSRNEYIINASVLNFIPQDSTIEAINERDNIHISSSPISWRYLRQPDDKLSLSEQILKKVLQNTVQTREVILGAGCFWHVEFALRRLPGVIDTKVGYAGGDSTSPTYKDVCNGNTNHAEVVKVCFDPRVCNARQLIDFFLAMHDPTILRSHGRRAKGSGQYRSCIFTFDSEMERIASDAVIDCRKQIKKLVSTDVRMVDKHSFWTAEDRHQLHDERVKRKSEKDLETLSFKEWLWNYGRRSPLTWGSSQSNQITLDDSDDDGMARMMI
mmetsp:Transcript_22756/g.26357  ORF Transcript_22756/g.26357 Transcript_22756/m.26357 type:complete len:490 (+) Transcript_22756:3-1472(+)